MSHPLDYIECEKGKSAPEAAPAIAPKPPVEEASVEIEGEGKKKVNTGKSSLKMPVLSKNTGLNI